MDDRSARFAETLGITDAHLLRVFADTPRHHFLPGRGDDEVYRDDAVPTRFEGNRATSSSTQPSLMAAMIEGLALRPGLRVLEIGAGTGYNAAIIARLTGGPVVSIDVQPDVVDEARKALRTAGISGVLVEHADGYAGFPARGPYDRIIVTCGIRGVPPGWLGQLRPGGIALVPLAHAGLHPIVRVERDGTATVHSGRAGFMHAAGALYPSLPDDFPPPIDECPQATLTVPEPRLRRDFWFTAGVLDRRITRLNLVDGWAPALVTGPGLAWWTEDEIRTAGTGPEAAVRLVDRWAGLGRPPACAWTTSLTESPNSPDPLLVATRWRLKGGGPS